MHVSQRCEKPKKVILSLTSKYRKCHRRPDDSAVTPMMPYLLAFAAGAMLYVVIEELIPETAEGSHSNLGTIGFALGFALMMVLDVLMG